MRARSGLARRVRRAGILIAVLVVIGLVVRQMNVLDRIMVYFPMRELISSPSDAGLEYRDVYLTTEDGIRIHAWHIPGETRTTLLWLHGNAGNISHRIGNIAALNRLTRLGVLIVDYRGYGLSGGRPSERGLYADAEAAFAFLVDEVGLDPEEEIVLFGRSLGVGVAAEMATRHRVRCVVLESGFASVREMAGEQYPGWMVAALMPLVDARYDTLSKMPRIGSPVMVLHGDQDDIVPFRMGHRIFDAAMEPKRFYAIRGASHNDTYRTGGQAYFEAIRDFIAEPIR